MTDVLSVVLATFDGSTYLGEQLESLNTQTRLPDELIVADDHSGDDTLDILRRFERRARFPVHVIAQRAHVGTCRNFEDALRAARGDLLFICDQDDRWHPEKLAVMAERMRERPDALLGFSDAVLVDADGGRLSRSRWRIAGFGPAEWQLMDRDPFGQMMMRQIVSGCTAAIRSELLEALLPFPEDLHPALPTMMYDRWISLLAAAQGSVLVIPERLVDYRIHPGQQLGIPALQLRRVAPKATLRLGQFVAPRVEKLGRFAYQQAHLEEISKRLTAAGLDTGSTELWLRLADEHLACRGALDPRRRHRARAVLGDYLGSDGYRRFSLGAATALSDLTR